MNYRTVAITGASSGIGAALAAQLATPGRELVLLARNVDRLEHVAQSCRVRGAACRVLAIDLCNRPQVAAAFADLEPDLLIANAGILDGRHVDEVVESGDAARRVLETNLLATIDAV